MANKSWFFYWLASLTLFYGKEPAFAGSKTEKSQAINEAEKKQLLQNEKPHCGNDSERLLHKKTKSVADLQKLQERRLTKFETANQIAFIQKNVFLLGIYRVDDTNIALFRCPDQKRLAGTLGSNLAGIGTIDAIQEGSVRFKLNGQTFEINLVSNPKA